MTEEQPTEISEILIEDNGHGKKYEVYKNGEFIGVTIKYPNPLEQRIGPRGRSNG